MEDELDIEAIRAKRLQQMQQQFKPNADQQSQQQANAEKQAKEEEFRNNLLSQLLSQEARARLNTISVAKPEKAKMVENILISNARMGIIRGKLSETDLIEILEKVSEQTARKTTVKYDRRRIDDDSDEET